MDEKDLYSIEFAYDAYRYFTDAECTKPYSGKMEDYFQGYISVESIIEDGYVKFSKEYFDNTHTLEMVYETNIGGYIKGLAFEFYKSGRIHYMEISYNMFPIDTYEYSEDGKLESVEIWDGKPKTGFAPTPDINEIEELRRKKIL